ncbi:MAG: family 43 glycosylhydrolase, partial [Candidatus Margulisbacteria bacterium]|nr:family 43 glycosylhydrolase [Candidatus Margulisiibacteriota bacterium]
STIERPKVIYNKNTGQFAMWFHLELTQWGVGYDSAYVGVAFSDNVTGPYTFIDAYRPNTHMSRDMALFVDDDETAYHISAADDNYDMRIRKLTPDYLGVTEEDVLILEREHREAPALFKHKGKYFLITSAATGWDPNAGGLYVADSIYGPWERRGNPFRGENDQTSFDSQSTFVLPVPGYEDAYLYMGDRWQRGNIQHSPYVWLPIQLEPDNLTMEWEDEWTLEEFFAESTSIRSFSFDEASATLWKGQGLRKNSDIYSLSGKKIKSTDWLELPTLPRGIYFTNPIQ